MSVTNGYCSVSEACAYLRIPDGDDNVLLELVINSVSRLIDKHCRGGMGHFYADGTASARLYVACEEDMIEVDDISTTTGLIIKTDEDGDGTFEATWSTTDYQLEPLNALADGRPVTRIRRRALSSRFFPESEGGQALVQVTATWGWPSVPPEVKNACLLQVARIKGRQGAQFGIVSAPDFESTDRLLAALDPDVKVMLHGVTRHSTVIPL